MEENKAKDTLTPSKNSSTPDKPGERNLNATSSKNVENSGVENSKDDNQMKVDQPEEDTQKMETEAFELQIQSEIEPQLGMTTGSKIERRRADITEYFGSCDIPVYHKVEFSVFLSFAMYYKQMTSSVHPIDKKQKSELPIALGYYHTEFRLLPTDEELTQIDIVPYNHFARVFIDKNETKTVKYHHDGHFYWVIWNQIFEVDITNDLLLQLFDYTLEINVWDTKDKLMSRTRFDKPRFVKIDIDEGDCKKQVNFQKKWLDQEERNTFTPQANNSATDNQRSSKVKDEIPVNVLHNTESEAQLEAVMNKLSSITLANADAQPTPTTKKPFSSKEIPAAKALVNLRYLFSDMCSITKRLEKPTDRLVDMLASVTLNKSLLSEQQKRHLNPMVITVHSLNDMPGSSDDEAFDYSQLKAKCHPVYLRYQFLHNKPYESPGKPHKRDISFNDINVILTGNLDSMELREFFHGPGLGVEIHDRDRKPSHTDHRPLLFGDDLNDEKFSNIGVITSKKTKINPYKSPLANSLDPFGVAHLDLSSFTLGQKFSHQEVSILNSPTLNSLQNAEAENVNFVKKINPDLSKENGPFKPGQYVNSCSTINVTIKLTYPIIMLPVADPRPPITPTYNCPFGRMVFRIATERQAFLEEILLTIARINGCALGLNDVPDNILIATLLTLITTKHQRFDRLLDTITGFHIIDESMHILVVEGLQNQGMKILIDQFGETDYPDVTVLFNTSLVCSDRLYASFDVILRKVKLHEPLDSIIRQPLIYIRDMVPRLCYDALVKIHELSRCSRLIDAIHNNRFPSANMVRSLSKEFGVVIKEEQLKINASVAGQEENKRPVSLLDTLTEELTDQQNIRWNYIDHYNKPYIQMLKQNLLSAPDDFITKNITLVTKASEKMKEGKEPEKTVDLPLPLKEVHNYGMSRYNSIELKKLELRRHLDPKSMYTYCPDFHHSMTFAPAELEHLYKKEEIHKKKKWRTPNGWVYPGFKASVDAYIHPKKPSAGRIDELTQPYEETLKFEERDPRERCAFTWSERTIDMDLWRQPTVNPCDKTYVLHSPGEPDPLAMKKEAENWKNKMVVKNMRGQFHRQLTETELQMQGRHASCQLDKLKGLLKDKPMRRTFRYRPVANMPSLNVVSYPELSAASSERKLLRSYDGNRQKSAYVPGPYWPERSLSLFGNHMLTRDYEHVLFADLKGEDFKNFHTPRTPVYKRKHPVPPVSEEEKQTDYGNLKNCFCRSHTAPEDWRRRLYQCPGPPYTADIIDLANYYDSSQGGTCGTSMNREKPESPEQMDR